MQYKATFGIHCNRIIELKVVGFGLSGRSVRPSNLRKMRHCERFAFSWKKSIKIDKYLPMGFMLDVFQGTVSNQIDQPPVLHASSTI